MSLLVHCYRLLPMPVLFITQLEVGSMSDMWVSYHQKGIKFMLISQICTWLVSTLLHTNTQFIYNPYRLSSLGNQPHQLPSSKFTFQNSMDQYGYAIITYLLWKTVRTQLHMMLSTSNGQHTLQQWISKVIGKRKKIIGKKTNFLTFCNKSDAWYC